MGKKYRNPPIIEAICEFQFEQDSFWDSTVPTLLYEKVQDSFPKQQQITEMSAGSSATITGLEQQSDGKPSIRFLSKDENILTQVGQHFLTINQLKPYSSWSEFLPLIDTSFKAYREVANPKGIHSLALKYINRIKIKSDTIKLADYFEFTPFLGQRLPRVFGAFIVGIQVPFENTRDTLLVQLMSLAPEPSDTLVIMLALIYVLANPGEIALDDVLEWLNVAHNRIGEAFEASIKDQLRQMFEEVTE